MDFDRPRQQAVSRMQRRRRVAVGLGASAVLLVAAVLGWTWLGARPAPPTPEVQTSAPVPPAPPPPLRLSLDRGQTLSDLLAVQGLTRDDAHRAVTALAASLNLRQLKPADAVELHRGAPESVERIVIRRSPIDIVEARRSGDGWASSRVDVPVERRVVRVEGALRENLFESMEGLGERPQLVIDFGEIFAYDFDFASDSQPGDRFRMLVEKVYAGEDFVRYGRILLAEYEEAGGRLHTAVYFRDGDDGGGYYTPEGESLRRAFLKSPLEFTRISSGYTRARRHPVLGGVRPHLAVDYAAPHGTPVWAVADGVVEFAGYSGGNGKTVVLRHRAGFKTMYNHLSRFSRGIRKGKPVEQRQVIGYVGSTGLSTGPHLDYRVMKDGVFVNPLKQSFLPGRPVSPASRAAFAQRRDALLAEMRHATGMQHAAAPPSAAPEGSGS